MRNREQTLNAAHSALMLWASDRSEESISGGIGYPERTQEDKWAKDGGILPSQPARCIVPEIKCDPEKAEIIRIVNAAIDEIYYPLDVLVRIRYKTSALEGERAKMFADETGLKKTQYYTYRYELWGFIAGRLPK